MENQTPNSQTPPIQSPAITPPHVSTQTPPQPAKPKSKFPLAVLVGIIVFFVSSAVIGFAYKDKLASLVAKPTPTPTPIVTVTPTPDPTAGWKTYTNIDKGYSIKYPSDSFARMLCPGEELLLQLRENGITDDTKERETCARDSRYDLEIFTTVPSRDEPKSVGIFKVIESEILVSGLRARKYVITHSDTESVSPTWRSEVYIDYKGKKFLISFNLEGKEKVFSQILSTFKFTDSQTVDTSSWKTYKNQEYGFELKYPPNINVDATNIKGYFEVGEYIDINIIETKNLPTGPVGDGPNYNGPTTKVQFAGKEIDKLNGEIGEVGGNIAQKFQEVQIEKGNFLYKITLYGVPDNSDLEYSETRGYVEIPEDQVILFDQILLTFKFTN